MHGIYCNPNDNFYSDEDFKVRMVNLAQRWKVADECRLSINKALDVFTNIIKKAGEN